MGGASNIEEVPLFLNNMFRDKHILRIGFKPLRYAVARWITFRRAKKSRESYRLIGGRSPLLTLTKSLAFKLQERANIPVFIAMRYLPPFTDEAIGQIKAAGIKNLVIVPLYPHYSTATTLSSIEHFEAGLKRAELTIKHCVVERFFDHPTYNESVIERIKQQLEGRDPSAYTLILSAHSLPQSVIDEGDPYKDECARHAVILQKLFVLRNMEFNGAHLAYQSKVGPMKWLEPSLETKMIELSTQGIKRVLIVPISFTIDNLETDYELSIDYVKRGKKMGFEELLVAKCPNDSDIFVKALSEISAACICQKNMR
jgi:ferrochelatase